MSRVRKFLLWILFALVLVLVLIWWSVGGVDIHLLPEDLDSRVKMSALSIQAGIAFCMLQYLSQINTRVRLTVKIPNSIMPGVLGKLFGSPAVVKILRLFLLNPDQSFDKEDVVWRTKSSQEEATYELALLLRIGVLKKKSFSKVILKNDRYGVERETKRRSQGWMLSDRFPYTESLRNLLQEEMRVEEAGIAKRLAKTGVLRLVVVSGMFTDAPESRLDMLVVVDRLKESALESAIRDIEAWAGKEVRFAAFTLSDFRYRRHIQDRLLRDVFDYPYRTILDRIGGS
jgi:hypothetical protein